MRADEEAAMCVGGDEWFLFEELFAAEPSRVDALRGKRRAGLGPARFVGLSAT
jgi:hypothetical protein